MPDKIVNHFVLADGSVARYDYDGLLNAPELRVCFPKWNMLRRTMFSTLIKLKRDVFIICRGFTTAPRRIIAQRILSRYQKATLSECTIQAN